MTPAPCRYCHQPPQPPGVACPSANGVTMHGCEPVAPNTLSPCIGSDPSCPCQDGDACHYRDAPGSPAWPIRTDVEAHASASAIAAALSPPKVCDCCYGAKVSNGEPCPFCVGPLHAEPGRFDFAGEARSLCDCACHGPHGEEYHGDDHGCGQCDDIEAALRRAREG